MGPILPSETRQSRPLARWVCPSRLRHFALNLARRPGVPGQLCVAREERGPFGQRLCEQQPVEGSLCRASQPSMLTECWLVIGSSV